MRMLLEMRFPNEPFNTYTREGAVGEKIGRALDAMKPESVYFTEQDGQRGAIMVVDVANPSRIPALCEPFFLMFNAEIRIRIAMTPEDLGEAGLDKLGKAWSR